MDEFLEVKIVAFLNLSIKHIDINFNWKFLFEIKVYKYFMPMSCKSIDWYFKKIKKCTNNIIGIDIFVVLFQDIWAEDECE